jgi:hypothetical protein
MMQKFSKQNDRDRSDQRNKESKSKENSIQQEKLVFTNLLTIRKQIDFWLTFLEIRLKRGRGKKEEFIKVD